MRRVCRRVRRTRPGVQGAVHPAGGPGGGAPSPPRKRRRDGFGAHVRDLGAHPRVVGTEGLCLGAAPFGQGGIARMKRHEGKMDPGIRRGRLEIGGMEQEGGGLGLMPRQTARHVAGHVQGVESPGPLRARQEGRIGRRQVAAPEGLAALGELPVRRRLRRAQRVTPRQPRQGLETRRRERRRRQQSLPRGAVNGLRHRPRGAPQGDQRLDRRALGQQHLLPQETRPRRLEGQPRHLGGLTLRQGDDADPAIPLACAVHRGEAGDRGREAKPAAQDALQCAAGFRWECVGPSDCLASDGGHEIGGGVEPRLRWGPSATDPREGRRPDPRHAKAVTALLDVGGGEDLRLGLRENLPRGRRHGAPGGQ